MIPGLLLAFPCDNRVLCINKTHSDLLHCWSKSIIIWATCTEISAVLCSEMIHAYLLFSRLLLILFEVHVTGGNFAYSATISV